VDYLARKIDRSKWEVKSESRSEDIRADALTGFSLRTDKDELSLWQCTSNREDIAEVVLALITNPRPRIEGIHIILFAQEELILSQITLVCSPHNAQTAIADLRHRHIDAVQLHMGNIIDLANKIATKVRQNIDCHSFTRKQVVQILRSAFKCGRLPLDWMTSLKPNEKIEIEQAS
jgi:hypothetical protein